MNQLSIWDFEGISTRAKVVFAQNFRELSNRPLNNYHMAEEILDYCCHSLKISKKVILGNSRKQTITFWRKLIVFTVIELCPKITWHEAALLFKRDHSTLMYSWNVVKSLFLFCENHPRIDNKDYRTYKFWFEHFQSAFKFN